MIKVKKLTPYDLPPPKQSKWGDAGYDLRAVGDHDLYSGEHARIPTGFCWDIPDGWCGQIWPRSGLALKHQIDTFAGLIDPSYKGEICVVLKNHGNKTFHINVGDRIAQMVVVPCMIGPVLTVSELGPSDRGGEGFGSTGRK